MKPNRTLYPLIALTLLAVSASAMAEESASQRFAPALHADVAEQDDVARGLGRTVSGRYAALPASWSSLGLTSSRTVMSLRADVLPGTSIVYEHAGMLRSAQPLLAGLPVQHTTRMGFEFRPTSLKNALPLGALRMQMSGNSSLLLRPRGGGLSVNWRSQF